MSGEPRVSVVVIFRDEERFLAEAIESVLAQTFGEWELLLVDDGSTDGSSAIALGYARAHPGRIRYLEHDGHANRGMSASRNLGLGRVRGTYVSFLDGDDVWLPEKLAAQVPLLDARPEVDLVVGPGEWWYSWNGASGGDFVQQLGLPLEAVVEPPALVERFLRDEWASLCDVLVRAGAVEEVGGYEDVFRGMYEDQAFHAKLCLDRRAYLSSVTGYRYRQHAGACTAVSHESGKTVEARIAFLTWLDRYLAERAPDEAGLRRLVRRELRARRHPLLHLQLLRARRLARLVRGARVASTPRAGGRPGGRTEG